MGHSIRTHNDVNDSNSVRFAFHFYLAQDTGNSYSGVCSARHCSDDRFCKASEDSSLNYAVKDLGEWAVYENKKFSHEFKVGYKRVAVSVECY